MNTLTLGHFTLLRLSAEKRWKMKAKPQGQRLNAEEDEYIPVNIYEQPK